MHVNASRPGADYGWHANPGKVGWGFAPLSQPLGELITMCKTSDGSRLVTVAAAVFAVWTSSALAADAERGRKFAHRACSDCHQVSPKFPAGIPPAPAFALIAKSKQFRAKQERLLWEKHGSMPNFALTADEAADVAAYIKSLANQRPVRK
jgi:mono/diheme cytochrome c family protein